MSVTPERPRSGMDAPFAPPVPQGGQPAGWYTDPWASGGQRYWNGSAWSQQVVNVPKPEPESASMGDWILAAIVTALLPLVGLILGIVYVLIGGRRRPVGVMCLVLSVVAFLAWAAVFGPPS